MRKILKLQFLFALLLICVESSLAQTLDKGKSILNIEEMRLNHSRFNISYLATLTKDERFELFKSYSSKGRGDDFTNQYVLKREAEFNTQMESLQNLSQLERESKIVSNKLRHNRTVEYNRTILNKELFFKLSQESDTKVNGEDALNVFDGYPVFVIKYYTKRTDGKNYLSYVVIKLEKTLSDIWRIGIVHAQNVD